MWKNYKWGVGILLGVFALAYVASEYGWGLSDESSAQAQGYTSSGGGGSRAGRSLSRASVRSFGSGSGSGWSSGGHHSGK